MKILFAGSFAPFTIGHHDIVDRALTIFDKVVVGIGQNISKQQQPVEDIATIIANIYKEDERVEVKTYEGLTVDFAKSEGISVLLRAVRSIKDYEYEREIAEVNRQISGIETILMFSSPQYAHISSSVVRELQYYGKDIDGFLP